MPPFAIFTAELDFLNKDNVLFAERGKKLNKLLDISDMPGSTHGYMHFAITSKQVQWFNEDEKLAMDLWVKGIKMDK